MTQQELSEILLSDNSTELLKEIESNGVMEKYLPEVLALRKVEQRADYHPEGDALQHTYIVIEKAPKDIKFKLAALLHDVGKVVQMHGHDRLGIPIAINVLKRFEYDDEIISFVHYITKNHMMMHFFFNMKEHKRKRIMRTKDFKNLMLFGRCDDMVRNGEDVDKIEEYYQQFSYEDLNPKCPITREDLENMNIEDYKYHMIFKMIRDKQFQGIEFTKESCLKYVKSISNNIKKSVGVL